MNTIDEKLAGLIGSRICHDLISPIGAVTNGLELMELAGLPQGPEADLVNQSAQSAAARIKYYRLAFGDTGPVDAGHTVRSDEIAGILRGVFISDRLDVHWHVERDLSRAETKAALLAIMCTEAALTAGGRIDVMEQENRFILDAKGPKLMLNTAPWEMLSQTANVLPDTDITIAPAAVQFAILPEVLRKLSRALFISTEGDVLTMKF
ncbi:MAG: histidine phosphotransferase family protein [Pseudomonadota bacterium]